MTWTCTDRAYQKEDDEMNVTADRPAGLSEEERALPKLDDFYGRLGWLLEQLGYGWVGRPEVEAVKRIASRAPLEAELNTERAMKEGCQNRLNALAAYVRESGMVQDDDDGDTVEKARLSLRRLRERVRELEAQNASRQSSLLDREVDLNTLRRRILGLEEQLAQAQKPAAKSLSEMMAEANTLAMRQRNAALETMIHEFLAQTGAKVEDCVLVEQMEGAKLTWHIEHRPKPAAPAGLPYVGMPVEYRWGSAWATGQVQSREATIDVSQLNGEGARRLQLSDEGTTWRRIPPAQTSREPAAPPPGEVSTENFPKLNLERWLMGSPVEVHALRDLFWQKLRSAVEADIRAAVEREAEKDKARIAELEAKVKSDEAMYERACREYASQRDAALAELETVKKQMGAECGAKHTDLAEVERLKGELERAKAAKRCPADGMSDGDLAKLFENVANSGETMFSTRSDSSKGERILAKARELFTPSETVKL